MLSVDCVNCLGQVYEDNLKIHVLLSAFPLDLLDSEDHVSFAATRMESTLGFSQVFFSNVGDEVI